MAGVPRNEMERACNGLVLAVIGGEDLGLLAVAMPITLPITSAGANDPWVPLGMMLSLWCVGAQRHA